MATDSTSLPRGTTVWNCGDGELFPASLPGPCVLLKRRNKRLRLISFATAADRDEFRRAFNQRPGHKAGYHAARMEGGAQ